MERKSRSKTSATVSLVALAHEERAFTIEVPALEIEGLASEFASTVKVTGVVVKVGRKVHLTYTVTAVAELVCDRSLEPYQEVISSDVSLDYAFDGELYDRQFGKEVEAGEIRGLREDAQEIDLAEDVRQDLLLALPMKRVAPAYRDTEIEDLYNIDSDQTTTIPDAHWAPLSKLKNQ